MLGQVRGLHGELWDASSLCRSWLATGSLLCLAWVSRLIKSELSFYFSLMQMNKTTLPLSRDGAKILVNVAC